MIFVTVGGQLPFDRLVRGVDAWAASRGRDDLFAQIGRGAYEPAHMRFERFLTPGAFAERLAASSAVVAHAGMGTILSALELGLPALVMPRRHGLGEHRNDHQVDTARRLATLPGIAVAADEDALPALLDGIEALRPQDAVAREADTSLVRRVRDFILA